MFTWETYLFKTWDLWTGEEILGQQDFGNHPLETLTKTLSGGSSERKDVLSKAWRAGWLMKQALENVYDLDIGE